MRNKRIILAVVIIVIVILVAAFVSMAGPGMMDAMRAMHSGG